MTLIVIYYSIFFFVYWHNRNYVTKNCINIQCLLAFLLLFVFFGFRDITILNDTPHYYAHLRDKMSMAKSINWFNYDSFDRFEPGYQIFENILAHLFKNPYIVISLSAFIISLGNILFIKKHNVSSLFFCLFLLLNYTLENQYSAIRQGLATILFYYGFSKYIEGKTKIYILFVLIASTFHSSAIMLMFLIPLCMMKYNNKTILLLILAFVVVGYWGLPILLRIFSTDDSYLITNSERSSVPIASFIFTLMNIYMLFIARKFKILFNIEIDKKYWLVSLACIFVSAMDVVFPVIGRVNMYLYPILVLTFSIVINQLPNHNLKNTISLRFFVIFITWFIIYNLIRPEWYHLYPYSFMDIQSIYQGDEVYDY